MDNLCYPVCFTVPACNKGTVKQTGQHNLSIMGRQYYQFEAGPYPLTQQQTDLGMLVVLSKHQFPYINAE